MTRQIYQNNSASTIAANVAATDTTIQVALGAMFPTPTGTDFFLLTLEKAGAVEIVRCTSRSGNNLTVQRAQEGTTATTFSVGDLAEMRITAGTLDVVRQEIIDARGDRTNLNNRITAISNVASPNAAGIVAGAYYDSSFHAGPASGTFGATASRFTAVPFFFSSKLRIDQLGFVVGTATVALYRCFICPADVITGEPGNPLFLGALELDCNSTGYKAHSLDFTFDADRLYWVGLNGNAAATIRGIPAASAVNFGLVDATATTFKTGFNKTGFTATSPFPDPLGVTLADLGALGTNIPSIRMRAAAL